MHTGAAAGVVVRRINEHTHDSNAALVEIARAQTVVRERAVTTQEVAPAKCSLLDRMLMYRKILDMAPLELKPIHKFTAATLMCAVLW